MKKYEFHIFVENYACNSILSIVWDVKQYRNEMQCKIINTSELFNL